MAARAVPHWADVLSVRPEVRGKDGSFGDLQMSLHKVAFQTVDVPYRRLGYYSDITQPTPSLVGFFAQVARRLGTDQDSNALFHLDQGMGGGKSHALVGLHHLGAAPAEFLSTELGKAVHAEALAYADSLDLSRTHVVTLCADHFSPGAPTENYGPATDLFGRFLWGLFSADRSKYDEYFAQGPNKDTLQRALLAAGRPVLILLDEIMDYALKLSDEKSLGQMPGEQAFLNALMDACDDVPRVALVVVMIRSELDEAGYNRAAQEFRSYLAARLDRNGTSISVTESQDFAAIIRRRLFEAPDQPLPAKKLADAYEAAADEAWRSKVLGKLGRGRGLAGLAERIESAYPFHPDLMTLVQDEWSRVQGFQRVRSTVSIFALTTLYWADEHAAGRWAPELVGVGDIPLALALGELVSSGLLLGNERSIRGYRAVAQTDITTSDGSSGRAVEVDARLAASGLDAGQPRPAERMATALFCYSLVARPQGRRGATQAELLAAVFVAGSEPPLAYPAAEEVFNALVGDEGLGALEIMAPAAGGGVSRYRLSVDQTARMYFTAAKSHVQPDARAELVWDIAQSKVNKGLFDEIIPVEAPAAQASPVEAFRKVDSPGVTRLVLLDPRRWTLLNGRDDSTRADISALFGLGDKAAPVDNAASCVVACVNTQRRDRAIQRAGDVLAWRQVLDQVSDEQADVRAEASVELASAEKKLTDDVRSAYQHYVYLSRRNGALALEYQRFEDDSSSLSGDAVWSALVKSARAVMPRGLSSKYVATLLSTFDRDLTLKQVTQAFYRNPQFPLVPSVDDIQMAVHGLLVRPGQQSDGDRQWQIVEADGTPAAYESWNQIAISSLTQVLRRYQAPEGTDEDPGEDEHDEDRDDLDDKGRTEKITPPGKVTPPEDPVYRRYTVRLENKSLTSPDARDAAWRLFSEIAKVIDPTTSGADHQLVDVSVTLTTREGDQGRIEDRATAAGGTSKSELDDF